MDIVLHAIAEPRRREILNLVRGRELSAGEIAAHFEKTTANFEKVTRPAISQHLKVLMDAGLITMRRQGTWRLYRARPEGLEEVRAFVEEFWDEGLQSLKQAAEAEERRLRKRTTE